MYLAYLFRLFTVFYNYNDFTWKISEDDLRSVHYLLISEDGLINRNKKIPGRKVKINYKKAMFRVNSTEEKIIEEIDNLNELSNFF